MPNAEPQLVEVMRGGKRVIKAATTLESRERCSEGLAKLPERYRQLRRDVVYPVSYSQRLEVAAREVEEARAARESAVNSLEVGPMASKSVVFWEVDAQRDFMLPGGALYVPGAEKTLPNLKRLVDAARDGRVFLVSSACQHRARRSRVQDFRPALHSRHARRGNRQRRPHRAISFAFPIRRISIGREIGTPISKSFSKSSSSMCSRIRKRRCSWISWARTSQYVVFGVVTEYCVNQASRGLLQRGRKVAVVNDAIETLDPVAGKRTIDELSAAGARLITTEEALALV